MNSRLRLVAVVLIALGSSSARADQPALDTAANAPHGTGYVSDNRGAVVQQAADDREAQLDNTARNSESPSASVKARGRISQLDKNLHLTAAQKEQIQALFTQAAAQRRTPRDKTGREISAKRKEARALMHSTRDQIRAVLTPDQQKTFDAMLDERRTRQAAAN